MTGKELVLHALKREKTDRIPWVPFVGSHAAALLGISASEYLKSADHIVNGVQMAIERYAADGIPVLFDLQLEAETLGCDLNWADDNPPSVSAHPLLTGVELDDLKIPGPEDGRIGLTLDATRRLREANPDTALYGLITGPFTLGLHLQGADIFMRMFDNPEYVHKVLDFGRQVATRMSDYFIDAGCDVVALVDPMTSQIGPAQFYEFVTPHMAPVFEHIRSRGSLSSFFVCGHAEQNLGPMCECGPDNVSVDENIPLEAIRTVCEEHETSFGGNLQLTSTLLLGSVEENERHALDCMKMGSEQGFILSPGCDLPYATPPENLEAIGKLIRDEYRQEAVRTLTTVEKSDDLLDLSDYGAADKVVVDVITLDSEACTPCQYMVEAVRKVIPQFEGIVVWREHKIKNPKSILFMSSLLVKNIPTICIDGVIKFVSKIPREDELIEAIERRILEKMRTRIHQRKGLVYVLGAENEATEECVQSVNLAVTELGVDIELIRVSEQSKIEEFGVRMGQTPAIVTAKYEVKSTREAPEPAVMKEWIKALL